VVKRHINPLEGSSQRWTKQVVLFVFLCVPERTAPYLLSVALIPSVFASVKMSDKWEEGE
jgi:hypothetical protein